MKKQKVFVGMKHGHLTVLREIERDSKSIRRYECLCDCGKTAVLRSNHFYPSREYCSQQCTFLSSKRLLDLTGKTINRWTVIEFVEMQGKRSFWKCSCSCGTIKTISGASLLAGQTKSCGCLLGDMKRNGRSEQELLETKRKASRNSNRKNPARVKANKIKYETKRLVATPLWASLDEMNKIYEQAKMLTITTGIKHQVDHIIPINGERVSGLHVLSNLQILTQAENVSKSNIYAELLGD